MIQLVVSLIIYCGFVVIYIFCCNNNKNNNENK